MSSNFVDLDPIDIAWCAGLFVGEGHCTVKVDQRWEHASLQLVLAINMCDEAAVRKFAAIFALQVRTYGPYRAQRRAAFRTTASGKRALAIARLLYPYMADTEKGAQCVAAVERIGFGTLTTERSTQYLIGRHPHERKTAEQRERIGAGRRAANLRRREGIAVND